MQKEKKFKIISFYKFLNVHNFKNLQLSLKKYLIDNELKGTIILSPEGINGSISGINNFIPDFNRFIYKTFSFSSYDVNNISDSDFLPFERPKVKIKKEVVPIEKKVIIREGKHISPDKWNEFIKKDDVTVIDIRKPFEHNLGSFKGSINPNVNNFREFKGYFDNFVKQNNKKIAIFCTGGIRCEKASEYLKDKGVEDVYQLEGGILNYLNSVPKTASMWEGECYVFDKRISVIHGSKQGSYSMCYGCRMPISEIDKKSNKFKEGISCPYCFDSLTKDQKKRFAMRQYNKVNNHIKINKI